MNDSLDGTCGTVCNSALPVLPSRRGAAVTDGIVFADQRRRRSGGSDLMHCSAPIRVKVQLRLTRRYSSTAIKPPEIAPLSSFSTRLVFGLLPTLTKTKSASIFFPLSSPTLFMLDCIPNDPSQSPGPPPEAGMLTLSPVMRLISSAFSSFSNAIESFGAVGGDDQLALTSLRPGGFAVGLSTCGRL